MFNIFKKKPMNYQDIDAVTFEEMMQKNDHVVLDVRSPQEYGEGKIEPHRLINFFESDFKSKVEQLEKDKTYLVYCRSGNRSGQACGLMGQMGFNNLYNLKGGIGAWNAKG